MILDAVEFHVAADDDDDEPVAYASAFLAAPCLWALRYGLLRRKDPKALLESAIAALGEQSVAPAVWVERYLDFVLTDAVFTPSAARFLHELIQSGQYHAHARQTLANASDSRSWEALYPIVDDLDVRWSGWRKD